MQAWLTLLSSESLSAERAGELPVVRVRGGQVDGQRRLRLEVLPTRDALVGLVRGLGLRRGLLGGLGLGGVRRAAGALLGVDAHFVLVVEPLRTL